jgi:cobalamin biosynthesis Mg chelatase CobN
VSNSPMTAFAQAALAISDVLSMKFASTRFSGSIPRVVKVQAPQVQSTGGGKQARESIVLMPESGDTTQALTAGFIDVGLRAVELRTYAAVAGPYQQRFGRALDLPKAEYDAFIGALKSFFGPEGYVIKIIDAADQEAKAHRVQQAEAAASKSSGVSATAIVGAAVVVVVLGAVAAFFALK